MICDSNHENLRMKIVFRDFDPRWQFSLGSGDDYVPSSRQRVSRWRRVEHTTGEHSCGYDPGETADSRFPEPRHAQIQTTEQEAPFGHSDRSGNSHSNHHPNTGQFGSRSQFSIFELDLGAEIWGTVISSKDKRPEDLRRVGRAQGVERWRR